MHTRSIWKPNKRMSHRLVMSVIEEAEEKINGIEERTSDYEKSRLIVFTVYMVISNVLSLRGNEGLMLDLGDLVRNWKVDRDDQIIIVL